MLILGIDPGTATTGYGVVKVLGKKVEALNWGLIKTENNYSYETRLLDIYRQMNNLLRDYQPGVIAIEKLFFATNAKTAMSVGQAQGVMLYCAARNKVKVVKYAPGTIKKVVAGNGKAKKKEIQKALRKVFGAKVRSAKRKKTHFDNAADALAVALCHFYHLRGKINNERG